MSAPQIIVGNARQPLPAGYTPIYVGRRTSYRVRYGEDFSMLGNPYTMPHHTRNEAIAKYRDWLNAKLSAPMPNDVQVAMDTLLERVRAGEALVLICWCAPEACHADVILEVLK